jgi:hypothetical protein
MASISGRSPLEIIKEAVRARNKRLILDAVTSFYIFRTDNQQVLARGVMGYDAARDKAKQIRSQHGLRWDQVSFKSEKKPADKPVRQNFGKGIVKQPGEHIYASPTNNLSGIRLQRKDWDE